VSKASYSACLVEKGFLQFQGIINNLGIDDNDVEEDEAVQTGTDTVKDTKCPCWPSTHQTPLHCIFKSISNNNTFVML